MKLKKLYSILGTFCGYYIQDDRGVNWSVWPTAKEAYDRYKYLKVWSVYNN
jgi:hypothetical protein